MKDVVASLAALAGSTIAGNITVATIPTVVVAAPVTVPVTAVVAIGGLLWCGTRMAYGYFQSKDSG